LDILDAFEDGVKKDPRSCGEMHPAYSKGNFWVYESPPIARLPKIFMLYEIDDEKGQVKLWNFHLASE
jgi:hypothetical protein